MASEGTEASLLTYSTEREKFESVYERNKFYRGLFGYKQTVRKNGKEYEYDKKGVIDEVPCVRIDDSVFIVRRGNTSRLKEYFSEWGDKVSYRLFTVVLDDAELVEQLKGEENE